VDEVRVLEIKKWLIAIAEENEFAVESIGKTKHVFSRLFSSAARMSSSRRTSTL